MKKYELDILQPMLDSNGISIKNKDGTKEILFINPITGEIQTERQQTNYSYYSMISTFTVGGNADRVKFYFSPIEGSANGGLPDSGYAGLALKFDPSLDGSSNSDGYFEIKTDQTKLRPITNGDTFVVANSANVTKFSVNTNIDFVEVATKLKLTTSGVIYPNVDGTSAIKFTKADGSTSILHIDTDNQKTIQKAKTNAVIGAELITNISDRDFSSDTGHWTGTNWTVGGGVYTHTAGANNAILSGYSSVIGKTYVIKASITTTTVGTISIGYGGSTSSTIGQELGTVDYTTVLSANFISGLILSPSATWAGYVDNVSIKEIETTATVISEYKNATDVTGIEVRTTNQKSFGLGINALRFNTGNENVAVGADSLRVNINGVSNTAIGNSSLYGNTTGSSNVSIGSASMYLNATGSYNTVVGESALRSNRAGSGNTIIGSLSFWSMAAGSNNVTLGKEAGRYFGASGTNSLTVSNNSIFVGIGTRPLNDNSENEIVIGYNAVGSGNNTVTIGNDNIVANYFKKRIDIGSATSTSAISVLHTDTIARQAGYNWLVNNKSLNALFIDSQGTLGKIRLARYDSGGSFVDSPFEMYNDTGDIYFGQEVYLSKAIKMGNNIVTTAVSKTLALTDNGYLQKCTNGSAINITVPPNSSVPFPIGTEIPVVQYGSGDVAFLAGLGVTIYSESSKLKINGQYVTVVLKKMGTDEWLLSGNLKA